MQKKYDTNRTWRIIVKNENKYKMELTQNINTFDINNIIDSRNYLNGKQLFYKLNNQIPLLYNIHPFDYEKGLKYFQQDIADEVENIYVSYYMNRYTRKAKYELNYALIVLKNQSVLHIGDSFCTMYILKENEEYILKLTEKLKKFKRRERKKEFEINLISYNDGYFSLKEIDVKKTRLDLKLHYEDEFLEIDKTIQERLNKKDDKGIVLLHGLPGTGKTTYLRYLIGKLKKRVLFVPPSVAQNITNPEFMNLLLDYPNSVLIIEDAENIIMDRQITGSSAVSNLLNISDGLLGDCLNTQIICTFNMPISKIDPALMRKGRLIAKYYFGKLSVIKGQYLSDKMKLNQNITEPMTIAEIFNHTEQSFEDKRVNVIGFRKEVLMN